MEGTSTASGKQLPYSRLRATVTDGRAANVFFRKNQLRRLNDEVLGAKADLLKAITNDSGNTATEAWVEFYLTLSALKFYFDDLDPAQELQDEYRIAHGRDAADAREAVGIVYIQPDAHSYLYSVVVPIGAAIAAGNCVLVVIEQTLKVLPAVLQKLLQRSLDPDTIEIAQSQVEDTAFLSTCVQVIQTGTPRISNPTTLHSPRDAPVIGVVDGTADVEKAARDLVTARFSFGGRSPYAPDVVLVNEHVKTSFLNAAMHHSIRYLTEENGSLSGPMRKTSNKTSAANTQADGIQVITSGSNGDILFVKDRAALSKFDKVRHKALYVHAVTSIDDAIDLANRFSNGASLLATYVFGASDSCKYLSQFINSRVAFANHILLELLVGPAAPMSIAVSPSTRYPVTAFSTPRPAYANRSAADLDLDHVLSAKSQQLISHSRHKLLKKLEYPSERPIKHLIGFFEQGILIGLGTVATPILLALGTAGYFGITRVLLPRIRG